MQRAKALWQQNIKVRQVKRQAMPAAACFQSAAYEPNAKPRYSSFAARGYTEHGSWRVYKAADIHTL